MTMRAPPTVRAPLSSDERYESYETIPCSLQESGSADQPSVRRTRIVSPPGTPTAVSGRARVSMVLLVSGLLLLFSALECAWNCEHPRLGWLLALPGFMFMLLAFPGCCGVMRTDLPVQPTPSVESLASRQSASSQRSFILSPETRALTLPSDL